MSREPGPELCAVVLCAGASSRMGRPKATLILRGRPLIAWHLDRLAGVARVVVVVGAHADEVRATVHDRAQIVVNGAWASTHPVDSLRLGLASLPLGPALVVPVDTPPARPETLRRLREAGAPSVPVDDEGRPGHPVLISAAIGRRVVEGPVPGGLRTLLGGARRVLVDDPLVGVDFDDPDAFAWFARRWNG